MVAACGAPSRITPLHSKSRATTGNETLPDAQGLRDNKYIHAFMYISNENLTQPGIMRMQGSDFVILDMHEVLQSEMYK